MRKIVLTALVAACTIAAHAQEKKVRFGVKGGLNVATQKIEELGSIDQESKIGFHVGGVVEFAFTENLSLQPEVVYSKQGTTLEDAGEKIDFHVDYVNVPIVFKYNNLGVKGFGVGIGPQVGFLVNAKAEGGGEEEDIKDIYKSTDFAAVLNLEYEFDFGLFIQTRYNFGFTDINDLGDNKIQNRVFQVSAGYKF
ncbi:MAG: PorT family protein [Flavobacterium sp.]|uniref:porin family protein n=1 Tax=Flavobacterium sp. TaxID=239 RepID=UPI0011F56A13|nr:porin family protein [Flavobacterium sp.]RZJ66034.1 MAG: PorT family protein [Flavobacterium sp.]